MAKIRKLNAWSCTLVPRMCRKAHHLAKKRQNQANPVQGWRELRMCSMWVNVDDCININCTLRLKTDS